MELSTDTRSRRHETSFSNSLDTSPYNRFDVQRKARFGSETGPSAIWAAASRERRGGGDGDDHRDDADAYSSRRPGRCWPRCLRRRRCDRRSGRTREGGISRLARDVARRPSSPAPTDRRRVEARHEQFAQLEARNVRQADIRKCARRDHHCRRHISLLRRRTREAVGRHDPRGRRRRLTFREPLGVVGLIVPWNFPLAIASWKVAPALAAGNTIVLKPAGLTPLTAIELERVAIEAGLPEGVLNVVVGPGGIVGERIATHPNVAKIAFTGSTDVGRRVSRTGLRHDQACHARTRRQVGEHHLRRRRPRGGSSGGAVRRLRQRRSGLLCTLANPRRTERLRPLPRTT